MDFLVYSRAARDVAHADDPRLNEEHWAYMDGFAAAMVARGPTLGRDRETWTGSLHVLDLRDAAAAEEFVAREPYNRAGLFGSHLVRRFENRLGRTMWEFARGTGEPRYLVLAHPREGAGTPAADIMATARDRLILHGDLFTVDTLEPAGLALALEAPTRESARDLVASGLAESAKRFDVDVLDWEFGGRR